MENKGIHYYTLECEKWSEFLSNPQVLKENYCDESDFPRLRALSVEMAGLSQMILELDYEELLPFVSQLSDAISHTAFSDSRFVKRLYKELAVMLADLSMLLQSKI